MWYILTMNKDVIYIEPEDDITDIITKIENSKEKIVALVPPKKAGVFRSVVNIKLVSKVGATAEKTIVLVTTDPSIVKLAAATRIPVTKNLQTPPAIPTADMEIEETSEEEIVDDDVHFSYQIHQGRATTRNAIKLLNMMGYEKSIVCNAEKRAAAFVHHQNPLS